MRQAKWKKRTRGNEKRQKKQQMIFVLWENFAYSVTMNCLLRITQCHLLNHYPASTDIQNPKYTKTNENEIILIKWSRKTLKSTGQQQIWRRIIYLKRNKKKKILFDSTQLESTRSRFSFLFQVSSSDIEMFLICFHKNSQFSIRFVVFSTTCCWIWFNSILFSLNMPSAIQCSSVHKMCCTSPIFPFGIQYSLFSSTFVDFCLPQINIFCILVYLW